MKKENNEKENDNLLEKLCQSYELLNSVRIQSTQKNNYSYSTAKQQM